MSLGRQTAHSFKQVETDSTDSALSCSGLEDQLLALVVAEERPDLEDAKNQLIVSNAKMREELKEIEDKILQKLSSSEGSPVDDVDLIQTLEQSKAKSAEIKVCHKCLYLGLCLRRLFLWLGRYLVVSSVCSRCVSGSCVSFKLVLHLLWLS